MHTRLASAQLPLWNALKKQDIDPTPFFLKAGLDPEKMHEPGARYRARYINQLHVIVQAEVGDRCIGLNVADSWHPSHVGTLGYALLMSKSIRDTLQRLVRYHKILSEDPQLRLEENSTDETLDVTIDNDPMIDCTILRETILSALLVSVLRVNYQQKFNPTCVQFTFPEPECSTRMYDYLKADIRFDAEQFCISFPLAQADQQLTGGNEDLIALKEQMMNNYLEELEVKSLASRVKKIITESLPSGETTIEMVAAKLYMSTRTLQRTLKKENISFHRILNESRMDLAKEYLKNNTLDLLEIAFLLGFSDQSAFSRSFKRWYGKSPVHFKNQGVIT